MEYTELRVDLYRLLKRKLAGFLLDLSPVSSVAVS